MQRAEELTRIEVADSGNTYVPTMHAMDEILRTLRYYAGFAYTIKGETISATSQHIHVTPREPLWRCGPHHGVQPS